MSHVFLGGGGGGGDFGTMVRGKEGWGGIRVRKGYRLQRGYGSEAGYEGIKNSGFYINTNFFF